MTEKSSYKHILKSTSLFGGVQFIQIVTTIIRGKFIAIFLGTIGMGISSLLVSSMAMLQAISGLGLSFSAVREISQAQETGDNYKLSRTITVFYRWLLFSAILGAIILIALAPSLSEFAFGNRDYIWEFVWLSIVIVINILSAGYQTLLQGTRRLKDIAVSSVLGSILSIITSLPIYLFWGIKGIVPALIMASLTSFVLNYFFVRKIKLEKVIIGAREILKEGSEMVKLGIVMMITSLISTLTTFLIIAYIKKSGSLSDVGLYQAGLSLTSTSVGLVFTAMVVDYYPRLSAISSDEIKVRNMVNQQSEIMMLITTPLVIILIITAPLLIRILLTSQFIPIINFIRWISIGLLFQAGNFAMGLISFSKGDKQTFLLLSIVGNFLLLFFSVVGYKIDGLNGIAGMFIIHSITCYFMVYITAYKKYNYWMSSSFNKIFVVSIFMVVLVYALIIETPVAIGYTFSAFLLGISIAYSLFKLDRLIGLKEVYYNFGSRFKRK